MKLFFGFSIKGTKKLFEMKEVKRNVGDVTHSLNFLPCIRMFGGGGNKNVLILHIPKILSTL